MKVDTSLEEPNGRYGTSQAGGVRTVPCSRRATGSKAAVGRGVGHSILRKREKKMSYILLLGVPNHC